MPLILLRRRERPAGGTYSGPVTPVGDAHHSPGTRDRLRFQAGRTSVESRLKLSRRAFLQSRDGALQPRADLACGRNGTPWRFLTIEEARALAAMSDQIIPPDQDAGASWAGVVNFIDRQLCGPYKHLQAIYRRGLAGVDQSSRALDGKLFADLGSEQQIDRAAPAGRRQGSGSDLETGVVFRILWVRRRSHHAGFLR